MEMWNKRDIPRPPDYTIAYTPEERNAKGIDGCIQELLESVVNGYVILSDEQVVGCFQREVAVLSASLYQNGRHRTEKFYSVLKKVQKCGEQWKDLQLASCFVKLRNFMPQVMPPHRAIRLPSRQMLEYLCVRVVGAWHLLQRLDGYCQQAAIYLLAKISSGHFFCTAMAFLANTARLRSLAVDLSGQLSPVYCSLVNCAHQLKGTSSPSLVPLTSLPPSLPDTTHTSTPPLPQTPSPLSTPTNNNNSIFKKLKQDTDVGSILSVLTEFEDDKDSKPSNAFCHQRSEPPLPKSKVTVTKSKLHEEDIGMCVEDMQQSTHTEENTKKRKKKKENVANRKKTENVANRKVPSRESIINQVSSNTGKNNMNDQSKQKQIEPLNQLKDITPSSISTKCVTPAFIKHYKLVKNRTVSIKSPEALRKFLRSEKKMRVTKSTSRVSSKLKKEDWERLKKVMLKRLIAVNKTREKNQSSHSGKSEATQILSKAVTKLKFWLLYPKLKGKKPENWTTILKDIKENR